MFARPEREKVKDSFDFSQEMVTKQSFKEECDIHNILAQYRQTGVINHLAHEGHYHDVSEVLTDYQASLHRVADAQAAFGELPAAVRKRYHDDPVTFLQAVLDPAEAGFLQEHGVLKAAAAAAGASPAADVAVSTFEGSNSSGGQKTGL